MAGIVHKEVKATGDQGLASEWNDDHEITGNVPFDQNQAEEFVVENRVAWPAGPVVGQIVYRSDYTNFYGWNGTFWQSLTPVATIVVAADGTGNYLTIQDGINALPVGGGVVYVKEGIYAIDAQITFPVTGVSVFGAGGSTRIRCNAGFPHNDVFHIDKNTTVLRDLRIDCNNIGVIRGVSITGGFLQCVLDNCKFESTTGEFIYIENSNENMIRGCVLDGAGSANPDGILIVGSDRILINNTYIEQIDRGIYLSTGSSDCNVSGNIIRGGAAGVNEGIFVKDNCDYNVITSNRVTGFATAIEINNATCDKNSVGWNNIVGNVAGFVDAGTATDAAHNVT